MRHFVEYLDSIYFKIIEQVNIHTSYNIFACISCHKRDFAELGLCITNIVQNENEENPIEFRLHATSQPSASPPAGKHLESEEFQVFIQLSTNGSEF